MSSVEPYDLLSNSRKKPYAHQVLGVQEIVELTNPSIGRVIPGCLLLADEMGAGKTKQVIDAAQILHKRNEISRVLVVAPAPVRFVWFDEDLGELAEHLWANTPARISEFRKKQKSWTHNGPPGPRLEWLIANYEYIRDPDRLRNLLEFCYRGTLLVLDESSAVKGWKSDQTRSCLRLRRDCGRVVLMNGTPISHSPLDLYSQANIMDPRIIGVKNYFQFRARYAVMGGFKNKQILSWQNLDDLQRRMAPYVLRRMKSDCLDLPEKLPPVAMECRLTEKTWRIYKEMRSELVSWLDSNTAATAKHGGAKAIRLSQITSGFLAGLHDARLCTCDGEFGDCPRCGGTGVVETPIPPREIGSEKAGLIVDWIKERIDEDPDQAKLMIWCRWRPELDRLARLIAPLVPEGQVGRIWGGQKKDQRNLALRLLHPTTAPPGAVVVLGTPSTGALGLNLTASAHVLYASNDTSLKTRLQSEDRCHRVGQTRKVWYGDVVASGPGGQRTIDHIIIKNLRARLDVATWTCAAWSRALREEEERGAED